MIDILRTHEDVTRMGPMTQMLGDVSQLLNTKHDNLTKYRNTKKYPGIDYPILEFVVNGMILRFAFPHIESLTPSKKLAVVGFFGKTRENVPEEVSGQILRGDKIMLKHLEKAPGVPFYVTYQIDEINSMNAIGFLKRKDMDSWAEGEDHRNLSRRVAPRNYKGVDICFYTLEQGLSNIASLKFEGMKRISYPTQNPA